MSVWTEPGLPVLHASLQSGLPQGRRPLTHSLPTKQWAVAPWVVSCQHLAMRKCRPLVLATKGRPLRALPAPKGHGHRGGCGILLFPHAASNRAHNSLGCKWAVQTPVSGCSPDPMFWGHGSLQSVLSLNQGFPVWTPVCSLDATCGPCGSLVQNRISTL